MNQFFFILKKYDHENLRKNIFLKGGKWYNMRLWQLIQHVFFMANIKKKKRLMGKLRIKKSIEKRKKKHEWIGVNMSNPQSKSWSH